MRYRYIGDGPFPLNVYGVGAVNAHGDEIEASEPIEHKHFELVNQKKNRKDLHEGDE